MKGANYQHFLPLHLSAYAYAFALVKNSLNSDPYFSPDYAF